VKNIALTTTHVSTPLVVGDERNDNFRENLLAHNPQFIINEIALSQFSLSGGNFSHTEKLNGSWYETSDGSALQNFITVDYPIGQPLTANKLQVQNNRVVALGFQRHTEYYTDNILNLALSNSWDTMPTTPLETVSNSRARQRHQLSDKSRDEFLTWIYNTGNYRLNGTQLNLGSAGTFVQATQNQRPLSRPNNLQEVGEDDVFLEFELERTGGKIVRKQQVYTFRPNHRQNIIRTEHIVLGTLIASLGDITNSGNGFLYQILISAHNIISPALPDNLHVDVGITIEYNFGNPDDMHTAHGSIRLSGSGADNQIASEIFIEGINQIAINIDRVYIDMPTPIVTPDGTAAVKLEGMTVEDQTILIQSILNQANSVSVPANSSDSLNNFLSAARPVLSQLLDSADPLFNSGGLAEQFYLQDMQYLAFNPGNWQITSPEPISRIVAYRSDGKPIFSFENIQTAVGGQQHAVVPQGLIPFRFDGEILGELSINMRETPQDNIDQINETDVNRLQFSAEGNPFVFPFKNNYPVGQATNNVNAIAAITDIVAETSIWANAFYVFCDDGIWLAERGNSDVLIESLLKFSDLLVSNRHSIEQTDIGLSFCTDTDVYIIRGRDIKRISDRIVPRNVLKMKPVYNNVEMQDHIILSEILLGNAFFSHFDNKNNELNLMRLGALSNRDICCFCFNTETGGWTTKTFNQRPFGVDIDSEQINAGKIINSPTFYRLFSGRYDLVLSKEDLRTRVANTGYTHPVNVLIRSRPIFTNASRIERVLTAIYAETQDNLRDRVKVSIFTSRDGVNYSIAEMLALGAIHAESLSGRLGASAMYYIIQIEGHVNTMAVTGVFLQQKTKITQTREINLQ